MSIPRALTVLFAVLSLALLVACQDGPDVAQRRGVAATSHPGTSFEQQLENLAWSAEVILEMDYTGKPAWDDFVQMFIGDEKELSGYYLRESVELLGW